MALPYIHIADGVDQQNIQNVEGLMYLIITETVFTFAYAVFHTFPEEIPQLLREIGNGLYKPSPYYVGKILLSVNKKLKYFTLPKDVKTKVTGNLL